jgi:putative transposase
MVSTQLRRQAVSFLKERGLSERRSCVLVRLSRSSLHYVTHPRDDLDLEQRLREIARKHKRYGYRRALAMLLLKNCWLRCPRNSIFRWSFDSG